MFTRAAGSPPLLVSSSWYDEPGPVGIPAVSVVIVWTLHCCFDSANREHSMGELPATVLFNKL